MRLLPLSLVTLALAVPAANAGSPRSPAAGSAGTAKQAATAGSAKQSAEQPSATKPATDAKKEAKPACRLCGGHCGLTPVCVCEPGTKKKPKTTYSMKCEPVCVPTPRLLPGGHGQAPSCTGQPCDGGCAAATIRTKKSLQKTITDEEVDVLNRKVEYICHHCSGTEPPSGCVSCTGLGSPMPRRPWWPWGWPFAR
jgi:hypothetical protein